jgi:hypothetical protein
MKNRIKELIFNNYLFFASFYAIKFSPSQFWFENDKHFEVVCPIFHFWPYILTHSFMLVQTQLYIILIKGSKDILQVS